MDELVTTDKPAPQAAEMRPYSAAELKAAVLAKLTYAVGKTAGTRHAARLVSRGHVHHPRHHRRAAGFSPWTPSTPMGASASIISRSSS